MKLGKRYLKRHVFSIHCKQFRDHYSLLEINEIGSVKIGNLFYLIKKKTHFCFHINKQKPVFPYFSSNYFEIILSDHQHQ